MSDTMQVVLIGVFTLASCVWVGGYVAIAIVARVASRTLEPAQRVATLAVGVVQARRMTRLRAASLAAPKRLELKRRVVRGARAAALLRAAIGLLSLALIALGSILAT